MVLALTLVSLAFAAPAARARVCDWCVFGNAKVTAELIEYSKKKPRDLLKEIRAKGLCVKVMESGRRVSKGDFRWGAIEKPTIPLKAAQNLAGLPGRFLCKYELPVAEACPTIVLGADSSFGTLLREYLRFEQATRDPEWCGLATRMWKRSNSNRDFRAVRDKEWDAALFFWNNKSKLRLTLADRITFTNAVINEAEQRKAFDPDGENFLRVDKPGEYLKTLNEEYQSRQQQKKKGGDDPQ